MLASLHRHVEVVDTLLQHGASVDLQIDVSAELLYYVIVYHVQFYTNFIQRCFQFFVTGILHSCGYSDHTLHI